jgi:hypothetical protein
MSAGFAGAYLLVTGAVTCLNVVVLGLGDDKFKSAPWEGWLELYWPFWSALYAPAATVALLAAWYSARSLRHTALLLGAFLLLIMIVIETTWLTFAAWPLAESLSHQVLACELTFLTGVFFVAALACRRMAARHATSTL